MSELLKKVYDPAAFREMGYQLVDLIANQLAEDRSGAPDSMMPWELPELRYVQWDAQLDNPKPDSAIESFEQILHNSIRLHHPRYMGHQVGVTAPLAALAGLMSDYLNNGGAVYEMGTASAPLERVLLRRVGELMGFGTSGGGFFTSGGTLANLTALLAARHHISTQQDWERGTKRQLAVMVSAEAHYCVDRAVRIMGWGEAGIIKTPVNDQFQMRTDLLPEYLAKAKAKGVEVIAVVGSACSTSTGSFDNLSEIGAFCAAQQLWFHVDGAHGAAAVFSDKYRNLVHGIELADSVTMDFHKMLMTPALCTALVFREERKSFGAFVQRASYLYEEDQVDWYNLGQRTFECTKYMMSIKVYMLWRTYGIEVFNDYVTRCFDIGQAFANLVTNRSNWQLLTAPQCNIVCFRYAPVGLDAQVLNTLNLQIRQACLEEGRFYIVKTKIGDAVWLRCTFTNPFSEVEYQEELLTYLEALATSEVRG